MSVLRSFRDGRLRRVRRFATVSVLVVAGLMFIGAAQAVHDNGMFELDGNTVHNSATTPPYDWNSLFGSTGNRLITPDPINGPLLADVFVSDAAVPDQSYFTSNKDIQPIASGQQHWGCDPINNPLNKDDLQNAYAALIQVPANAPDNAGHQVLYIGSERGSNNGTSFAGFWLLKDKNVGCSGTNDFSGQHTDGDLLIVSDYTNGGGTQDVSVYKWVGNDATGSPILQASFNGSICSGSLSNDNACAIANGGVITTPWSPTLHTANTFVETGIDLTTLLGSNGGCFTNFLAETRSSDVLTATLKDFASGSFNTCVTPPISTTATPGGSTNPLHVDTQHDVATISPVGGHPAPTGTMTFFLCNPSQVTAGGCVSGGTQVGGAITINAGSATSANAGGALTGTVGKYCWRAEYTPDTDGAKFYVAGSHTDATDECFTVVPNTPSISTLLSDLGPVAIGTSINDSSTLHNQTADAGGTVKYAFYSSLSACNAGTFATPGGTSLGTKNVTNGVVPDSDSTGPLNTAGTYYFRAFYSGDPNNTGPVSSACADETLVVSPNAPSISTLLSDLGPVAIGTSINDSSTLHNQTADAGGTVKYAFYSSLSACNAGTFATPGGTSLGTKNVTNGVVPDSDSTGPLNTAGTYYFRAFYSGDPNNTGPVSSACADETLVVSPNAPSISTLLSDLGPVAIGTSINDSSTLHNQTADAGGTVKYAFYSSLSACNAGTFATPGGTSLGTKNVTNGVVPDSDSTGPLNTAGTYYFRAFYSGDPNNTGPVSSACADETLVVSPNAPSISTLLSDLGPVAIGTSINDSSTLHNQTADAGGTVKYAFYSSLSACNAGTFATPGGTSLGTKNVTNGVVPDSDSTGPLNTAGTYYFRAFYSGDPNNTGPVSSACADETLVVSPNAPSISTLLSDLGPVAIGTSINDSSTLHNQTADAGGTVKYAFYSSLSACNAGTFATPGGTSLGTKNVTNGVVPDSDSTGPLNTAGTYYFRAFYSGDPNNTGPVSSACADETLVVSPNAPTVSTLLSQSTGNVGDTVHDSATINGATSDAGGTISYAVYSDDQCSVLVADLTPADNTVVNGVAPDSKDHTFNSAGTFYFQATYSGDNNNTGPVSSECTSEQLVINAADIHIVKTADAGQVNAGEDIGFTLTVWNSGAGDAKGVTLSDTLPTNAGLDWSIESQGAGWNGTCAIAVGVLSCGPVTVPANTTQGASTFTVHIVSGTTAATGGDCEESGLVDNTGSVTTTNDGSDESSAEICVAGPAIHILKTADATQVSAGEQIGFTMTVWNSGVGDAKGVTLSDTLPTNAGLDWSIEAQGAGWNGTCAIAQGVLSCGPVTVPAGTTQAASTFTVHIVSGTTAATGGDCVESGLVDNTGSVTTTNDGSDESSAEICVAAPAIHIAKTADAASVSVGDSIGFTMTVWNDGIGDAHGVTLHDVLPTNPGLSWSIDAQGAGWNSTCAITAGVLSCGPVTVPAGTTQDASTFTVHITSATTGATGGDCPETGVVNNTGDVTTTNDGSDESSASTCVQALVDLTVTKSGSPASQELNDGSLITWTMVVTNNGPSDATGVVVSDPMPGGNTFVSATITKGSCTGGAILNCTIGPMAVGESVTITLVTKPSAVGVQTNTVTVAGDRPETNTGNNSATATVEVVGTPTPPTPCVAVSKVTPKQLFVGRKTALKIHVTQGGKAVKGIHVRIKGAKINVRTKASNANGLIKQTLKMKKAGILVFTPIASKACNTKRVGVTNVFTPPVTG